MKSGVVNLSIMRRWWNANSALAFCSSVSEEVSITLSA
jgi:hypothetical protein